MQKFFAVVPIIFHFFALNAQQIQVSGYVTDSLTGENLIGATILHKSSNQGVATNEHGFYSITIDTVKVYQLHFSYVGYKTKVFDRHQLLSMSGNVELTKDSEIEEVEIIGLTRNELDVSVGNHIIKPVALSIIPALGGEGDIMHYIKMLPGVQSDEGSSSISVRGGNTDQNLVLMDGSPVYNVNHFGGIFSLFNADIIQHVKFYKGGFPAHLGGRLSSITDVRLRNGNINDYAVSGSLGLLSSKLAVEGPIVKNKSSFLFSGRSCMYPLYRSYLPTSLDYYFYDMNLKLNYIISGKSRIFFSFYQGKDLQGTITPEEAEENTRIDEINSWGNQLVSGRLYYRISPRFVLNWTVAYSDYNMEAENISETMIGDVHYSFQNYFQSGITSYSSDLKLDFYLSQGSQLTALARIQQNNSVPSLQEYSTSSDFSVNKGKLGGEQLRGTEYIFALAHKLQKNRLTINYGLRSTFYITSNKSYLEFEPRLASSIKLPGSFKLQFAFDRVAQNIHVASANTIGLPIDYWLPITNKIKPKKGWQVTAGLNRELPDGLFIGLEAYYNRGFNYLSFVEGKSLFGYAGDWEEIIYTDGDGKSKGIELSIEKHKEKFSGAMYATLSKALNRFQGINGGTYFPADYDRRFSLHTYGAYHFSERWSVSLQWYYGSGFPITLPTGKYTTPAFIRNSSGNDWLIDHSYNMNDLIVYGDKNSQRMEASHRLDLAFNWKKYGKKGQHIISLNLFNVYARINPYYYYLSDKNTLNNYEVTDSRLVLYKQGLIPFLPSISYSFKFGRPFQKRTD